MSRYIATRAMRGAHGLVTEAELMLNKALADKDPIRGGVPQYRLLPAGDFRNDRREVTSLGH